MKLPLSVGYLLSFLCLTCNSTGLSKFDIFLLQELEKGRYSTTDIYVHHMAIGPGSRDALMLTDKRVMYIVHSDIFGGWQVLKNFFLPCHI
jgi:hypothetical protein